MDKLLASVEKEFSEEAKKRRRAAQGTQSSSPAAKRRLTMVVQSMDDDDEPFGEWPAITAQSFMELYATNGRLLGKGNYGSVFALRSLSDSKLYAVKFQVVYTTDAWMDDSDDEEEQKEMPAEELRREVVALQRLGKYSNDKQRRHFSAYVDHFRLTSDEFDRLMPNTTTSEQPFIGKSLDTSDATSVYVLVTELVSNARTLGEIKRDFRESRVLGFSEEQMYNVYIDTLRFLDHMHELRIFHRDLNPGNIMVRDDGTAAVIDFGVACGDNGGIAFTCRLENDYAFTFQRYKRYNAAEMASMDVLFFTYVMWALQLFPPSAKIMRLFNRVLDEGKLRFKQTRVLDDEGKARFTQVRHKSLAPDPDNPVSANDAILIAQREWTTHTPLRVWVKPLRE